ncbi:hypothetical protein B4135_1106 [Caldibacillus debilis]|uniref:Uncharacterized protein n=1 Tax=Caldibacillus debilis TaxID=301148 RepID=A0A150MDU8_9BACI|nr:hypothetical protein B4135_1106 [Caldibacillus debilis]
MGGEDDGSASEGFRALFIFSMKKQAVKFGFFPGRAICASNIGCCRGKVKEKLK